MATAKKNWERTRKFLVELFCVREVAQRAAAKLNTVITAFIYQHIWRGANVERWADLAMETPHDKPGRSPIRRFAWLCGRKAMTQPTPQAL